MGTARIDGRPVAVMSYDYSVLRGHPGLHDPPQDRPAARAGRPGAAARGLVRRGRRRASGDTDTTSVAGLDVPTFRLTAGLSGRVPLVAVVSGYCFAGNAASPAPAT